MTKRTASQSACVRVGRGGGGWPRASSAPFYSQLDPSPGQHSRNCQHTRYLQEGSPPPGDNITDVLVQSAQGTCVLVHDCSQVLLGKAPPHPSVGLITWKVLNLPAGAHRGRVFGLRGLTNASKVQTPLNDRVKVDTGTLHGGNFHTHREPGEQSP